MEDPKLKILNKFKYENSKKELLLFFNNQLSILDISPVSKYTL
mgnify:CR=1